MIIVVKIYIQKLWIRQSGGGQSVDEDFRDAWLNFKTQLPDIEHIQFPRWRHTSNSYVAVFVCIDTRAVHLELVSDYLSKAFIAAYRRFTSHQGLCKIMYSDHGTAIQGAVTDLRKLFKDHSNFIKEVSTMLETDGVE